MDQQIEDMICKHLETELDKIAKMPSITDAALNNLHKLTDTKKNLLKIRLLEEQLNGNNMGGSYGRNNYGGSYGGNYGGSYGRDNYSRGRYDNSYGMGGYSRNDMYSHLEAAMRDARNEQEREEIRQLMTRYHN